jgi:hypothetical protein
MNSPGLAGGNLRTKGFGACFTFFLGGFFFGDTLTPFLRFADDFLLYFLLVSQWTLLA